MTRGRAIVVAQTVPVRGDVAANVERHLRVIRAVATEAPQAVLFPELSLTGYELDLAPALAFTEGDSRLGPLLAAAAAARTILVVGAPVRIGSNLHIGAFVLSPEGGVALYTKRRLGAFPASASPDGIVPPPEAAVFQPGDRDPLVSVGGRSAAVAVCADAGDPGHPEKAATRGATLYLASMFLTPSDLETEAPILRGYAERHRMVVAMANFGGPSGGLPSGGGSGIWSQRGELLVRLGVSGAGCAIAVETDAGWWSRALMLDAPSEVGAGARYVNRTRNLL